MIFDIDEELKRVIRIAEKARCKWFSRVGLMVIGLGGGLTL